MPQFAASPAADSDADPATGRTAVFFLSPGQNDLSRDAGVFLPKASIGDYVWCDLNANGCQDPGENPVQGVKVVLLDQNGGRLDSTHSDGSGFYQFAHLMPGDYRVEFSNIPFPYQFAQKQFCNDAAKDSDPDPVTGITDLINLWAGENETSNDAGLVYPSSSISGRVGEDLNNDGIQNPGENGLANVLVFLYSFLFCTPQFHPDQCPGGLSVCRTRYACQFQRPV